MKKKTVFNLKNKDKYSKTVLITTTALIIFFSAMLIATSGYKVDQNMSDGFGGAMLKTNGGFNDFVRGGSTYFILDAYLLPYIFAGISVFIFIESVGKCIAQKHPAMNNKMYKHGIALVETIISGLLLAYVFKSNYSQYTQGTGFGKGFYMGTMAGKNILLSSLIINCIAMGTVEIILTLYVHNVLANKQEFAAKKYGKVSILNLIFFILMNYEFVNGLKTVFQRPYEVEIKGSNGVNKIKEIAPDSYQEYLKQGNSWGDPHNLLKDLAEPNGGYPGGRTNVGSYGRMKGGQITDGTKDAFPSGHMNTVFFDCATLYLLFRNPEDDKQKIMFGIAYGLGLFYALNMVITLEMTGSHGMSDMSFTVLGIAILYPVGIYLFKGLEYLFSKIANKVFNKNRSRV